MDLLIDFKNIVEVIYFSTTNIDYFKQYEFGEIFQDKENPDISTIVIPVSKIVDFLFAVYEVVNKQTKMTMKKEEGKVWLFIDNSNEKETKNSAVTINRQPQSQPTREWNKSLI